MAQVNIGMRTQSLSVSPLIWSIFVQHWLKPPKLPDCNCIYTGVIMLSNETGFKHAWLAGNKIGQTVRKDFAG